MRRNVNLIVLSIFIDYPAWFIFLCILAGAIYASALYAKDRNNRHLGPSIRTILAIFRFAVISILAFFLLKPLIKSINRIVEKPIIVIAQDNSSSILNGGDTAFYKAGYLQSIEDLKSELENDYELRTFKFGTEVNEGIVDVGFTEPSTNFSALSEVLFSNFSNRNLGAVIIASDGLYNRGNSPRYSLAKLKAPIYTIAMGDTTPRRDLLISEIRNNRLAYLGNRFPIEVQWDARELKGQTANLSVSQAGTVLFKESFPISSEFEQIIVPVILEAKKPGLQRYTVKLDNLEGEASYSNNSKELFIDVLDSRQKLLILGAHPHPDIASIHSALKSNENYEVEALTIDNFEGDIKDYSLVIFHQLPDGSSEGNKIIERFLDSSTPSLFIVGAKTDAEQFNKLTTGIKIRNTVTGLTELGPSINKNFSLFTVSDELRDVMRRYPPLSSPSPDVEYSAGIQSLVNQKVGVIETQKPLISFFQSTDRKTGVILGEGIWRWRIENYAINKSHDLFNELWVKSVQYLAAKKDKSLFKIKGPEDILETDRILFEAELYDESFEPVSGFEIKLSIFDESGQEYPFVFSETNNAYRLDAGQLPVGEYSYSAIVNRAGMEFKDKGEFVIKSLQLEDIQSRADHAILYQLASRNGGEMFAPNQVSELEQALLNSNQLKSTAYEQELLSDLINSKWILLLLVALLSAEWLIRKRSGTY